jgi:cytoskeletal protein CcmA (bactofilin family)
MFGSKGNKPQSRIDCLIGTGTTIEGNITFTGGLRVDGHVRGSVVAADGKSGTLVLSEQAHIEGEIRVSHVVINGAVVQGRLVYQNDAKSEKVVQLKPATAD